MRVAVFSNRRSVAAACAVVTAGALAFGAAPAAAVFPPPTFTADSPGANAAVGTHYSYTYKASVQAGDDPAQFSVSSGALPDGLSLTSAGVLSGRPTKAGIYTFTVAANDGEEPTADTPSTTITVSGTGTVFAGDVAQNPVTEMLPDGGGTSIGNAADPREVAVDAAGDVFISSFGSGKIVEVPADGRAQFKVATVDGNPYGVAVGPSGNVFIANTGENKVVEVPADGGKHRTLGHGLSGPVGLAVDSDGHLFIADTGNDRVVEVKIRTDKQTTVGKDFKQPAGVAVTASGNVFVADTGHNRVIEVPAKGSQHKVGHGLSQPSGVAVNASGAVFIADTAHNRIVRVPRGNGTQTVVDPQIVEPYGVAAR